MVVTEDLRSACPRGAICVHQKLRIDFEAVPRIASDVGRREDALYLSSTTEQDAATLGRLRQSRLLPQPS